MGARRPSNDENLPQVLDGDFTEHDTHVEDDQDAVEREILAEAGASENQVQYEIRVFRIPDSGNTYPSLFTIPGENVAGIRDRLAEEYGTGHYELRVYKNKTLYRRLRIKIELPRTKPQPVANAAGDALTTLVAQQGRMMETMSQQLAEMRRAPPPPAQSMAAAMGEMAALMTAMQGFLPKPAAQQNPLEMLSSVITLVKDVNNDGREKGMMEMVSDFLQSDIMKTVVTNMTPQQQPAQPQRQLAPPPTATPQPANRAAPAPAPAPTPAAEPQDANAQAFFQLLGILVSAAAKNSDPILYADFIEDNVSPDMLAQLLGFPDPVAMLAQYDPRITTHSVWFGQVIEALTDTGEGETTGGAPNQPAPAPNAVVERASGPASSADGPS